jgi:hypothetical protein
MATGRLADFQTLATFPLTFLVVLILRVSLLVPLLFTAPITLMSSGDTAILTTAGNLLFRLKSSRQGGRKCRFSVRSDQAASLSVASSTPPTVKIGEPRAKRGVYSDIPSSLSQSSICCIGFRADAVQSSWPFQTRSATAGFSNVEGAFIRLATSRNFAARTGSRFADLKSLAIYQLTKRTCAVRLPSTRSCCRSLPTAIRQGMSINRAAERKKRRPIPSEPLARHPLNVTPSVQATVMP